MRVSVWPTKPTGRVCQPLLYDVLHVVSQILGNKFRINSASFPDFQLDPYTQNSATFFSIINISICTLKNGTEHTASQR